MSNAQQQGSFVDLPTAMRLYRRRKRLVKKAQEAASEIRELNIVAMVDVLTILLIFLLKSVSVSSTVAPDTPNMVLPLSTTQQPPIEAVKVTVASDKIYVEDEVVATIKGGAVPDSEADPDSPMLVPGLQTALRRSSSTCSFWQTRARRTRSCCRCSTQPASPTWTSAR
jgi:hypothetical protein